MTDTTTAAPAASEGTSAPAIPAEGPLTVRQAAESITFKQEQRQKAQSAPPPVATEKQPQPRVNGKFASAPPAEESSGDEPQDAAPTEASGETEGTDPVELPPVDPPKSWTKEDKEWFAELPPEKQARIAEREKLRDQDFSRRQNEATQAQKAAEAAHKAAQERQQQIDEALPRLLQALQQQTAGEFADIKTQEDVVKMATEDPFRYTKWDAQQKHLARVHQEVEANQKRQADDHRKQFTTWADEQDKAFLDQAKDFADPAKAPKLREGIVNYLTEVRGIEKDALPGLWNNPLFRDARTQSIFYDAYRWNEAQKAAKAAAQTQRPAPTRPGVAPSKGAGAQATIQSLEAKFSGAKTTRQQIEAAAALRAAKRAAGTASH